MIAGGDSTECAPSRRWKKSIIVAKEAVHRAKAPQYMTSNTALRCNRSSAAVRGAFFFLIPRGTLSVYPAIAKFEGARLMHDLPPTLAPIFQR